MSSPSDAGDSSFSVSASRRLTRAATLQTHRPICKHHESCYRKNPEHLKAECHPADHDYLDACRIAGIEPRLVSVRKVFDWCDKDHSGNASRTEIAKVWVLLQKLGKDVGPLTDEVWSQMDDDGNGTVNFGEFAEFTTKHAVELPLGLDDLLVGNSSHEKRCGVQGCGCKSFVPRRRQCKYGETCYQTNPEHRESFCHPGDQEWELKGRQDVEMCRCGHKKALHSSATVGTSMAAYPGYWTLPPQMSESEATKEFNQLLKQSESELARKVQNLINRTYSDVTTRDRKNHCKTWEVPRDFTLKEVFRNENSKNWRKYTIRRAELQQEKRSLKEMQDKKQETFEYHLFNTKTTENWEDADRHLDRDVNEWYLFHGTSSSAARNICGHDFQMRLAGSNTGTLYGRGTYLAESITKADEYSKEEGGYFTVLLCRVLGGRVRYCAEREPDPKELTQDCISGEYDSILGDREAVSGTYKEFVIFDSQNIYPEYIFTYKRGEFFKSKSHP
mmetsp:Transcript_27952/g.64509  ORF Transcript_27952/g.64509 Transcript_27952/m.64509 type:complete len:503 (+) Transcript_27952:52-1560(+)